MPMHDWKTVEAGIFHDFHHEWISELKRTLNSGLLPADHYAMAEQIVTDYGPDVLALQFSESESDNGGTVTLTRTQPQAAQTARLLGGIVPRKKSHIAIRHVSGDRVVAVIEIVSPGNKSSTASFNAFLTKAHGLLAEKVHLLLLDPFPPGRRDPHGIHAALWDELGGGDFAFDAHKPLTFVAYEAGHDINAFIEPLAVGDTLPTMPLFLAPSEHILLPLEPSYQAAWEKVPARWRTVISDGSSQSKN
jgi:hypothetical protein